MVALVKPAIGLLALGALLHTSAAAAEIVYAGGEWAAIRHSTHCEALARSTRIAPNDRPQARAGFSFGRGRVGEFHVRLSRASRPGSTVILTVGNRPFLLLSRGEWAWSRGPAQEAAIIAAVRSAGGMRVEARDRSGRRLVDRYLLRGAPTAIDAAAAACTAAVAGKKS